MNRHCSKFISFAYTAIALFLSGAALAQNSRSYVSINGRDSNDCTVADPCRSINRALAVTDNLGEVVIASSGVYAPATISKPVTISAVGVNATIVTTDIDSVGLKINLLAGDVFVRGLSINGSNAGSSGITTPTENPPGTSFHLSLYNIQVQGYEYGVRFATPNGQLDVYNSQFGPTGGFGALIQGSGATAYVDGSTFDRNLIAIQNDAGTTVTVSNSSVANSNQVGASTGGTMILFKSRIVGNLTGLATGGNSSKIYLADCLISGNRDAWDTVFGGVISGTSPGTSLVVPGQVEIGSLGPTVDLK
jgi:hypothetical protein